MRQSFEKERSTMLATAFRYLAVFLSLALSTSTALATETTSSIKGRVYGGDNVVANASVVITDQRTGRSRSVTTNEAGVFFASKLSVGGPYLVVVNDSTSVTIDSLALGDVYDLDIQTASTEELVIVTATRDAVIDVAPGPTASYGIYDLDRAVAPDRDIQEVFSLDPRLNLDTDNRGYAVNCMGKHPRFNTVTLDGVRYSDLFGLNSNGYSTAVGMPFPYDAIQQVAVQLSPFTSKYGGFSACNINAVTRKGSNEWNGNVFYEYTSDEWDVLGSEWRMRGDTFDGEDYNVNPYEEKKYGFALRGALIENRLFVSAAYEFEESPRAIGQGYAGSGIGDERSWLSEETFNLISDTAQSLFGYDAGGAPSDGAQEATKYFGRIDYLINDQHEVSVVYNYFDGFQDRASDSDSDEFEYANHFYVKGAEQETISGRLISQWNDQLSTEVFYASSEMFDSQTTVGPKEIGDHQISLASGDTVYLGADDSRQANKLEYATDYIRLEAQYLTGNHVVSVGYEREELEVFNQFVQHSNGGEYDYYTDSGWPSNTPVCAAYTPAERLANECALSGLDRFLLGRPSQIYYGSGGGTNNPDDAAAQFTNTTNVLYIEDNWDLSAYDLSVVLGLRYEWFETDDAPNYNAALSAATGIRNDESIDGLDILMPRIGLTWTPREDLLVRGGVGIYSGGNPNVWISNSFSNDGLTNVQIRYANFDASTTLIQGQADSITLSGQQRPGYDVPQSLIDTVAAVTPEDGATVSSVFIDPTYEQPSELKIAVGATYDLPFGGVVMDVDYIYTKMSDPALYFDTSQVVTGTTALGLSTYDYADGVEENFMLSNASAKPEASTFSIGFSKRFDFGLDVQAGYAYTDAEDVSPMTSSVAGSNFSNVALNDINSIAPAASNYMVPHRFTMRAVYERDFFEGLTTRVMLFGYAAEGQPQSFVMSSSYMEGDGFYGRHLLYIPSANDPNVTFGSGFDQAGFQAWADEYGFGPGFVSRNEEHARWSSRLDLRIDQELPTFIPGTYGRVYLKIYNLSNLINSDWGKVTDAEFFSRQVVNSSLNEDGMLTYESFRNRSVSDVQDARSVYEIKAGVEFRF